MKLGIRRASEGLRSFAFFLFFALVLPAVALAQTGRIAGTVTDAVTGEALIGVNVVIDGTTQGTVTNAQGYFSIINVSPGVHTLRVSYIGYSTQLIEDVRVSIDQTTTINVRLREEAIGIDEVVVVAERPIIQRDVAGSTVNISSREVENLPVSSITGAVGLQAGVQGLTVRGSSSDQLAFMVNGLMLRDERNNAPVTGISMAAVEEVQVQTGGFNAEYGNVRSGVVNVVTKEGRRDRYNVDMIVRYAPAQRKHFGPAPNDPNSYWIRPYLDPTVAFTGTGNGSWDWMMRRQYPDFEGWVAVAQQRIRDGQPALTPEALQQAFLWQHRKSFEINDPDYDLDIGFGGPVPLVSRALGGLRFYASLRQEQEMYMLPLHTDRFLGRTAHVKLTSDVGQGMKLSLEGMLGNTDATSASAAGAPGIFRSASGIASNLSRVSFIPARMFGNDYWAPTNVQRNMLGARFTHAIDANTFYEIRALRHESAYDTNPGRFRNTDCAIEIAGVCFDEGPFGFYDQPSTNVAGMRMSIGMSTARDSTRMVMWNIKGDFTRQMNQYLQVKTGGEFNLTENRVNYGRIDPYLPAANEWSQWNTFPLRGAAYAQSKLEFQGMVANVGVRMDYSHAGGEWYEFDPFSLVFSERLAGGIDTLLNRVRTDHIFVFSPRLGVSFPITENSKLFFNYGHFRSMPTADDLFMIRREAATGAINRIADPNSPPARTVAYEIGFEQAFLQQFLLRAAGYYRDVSLQPILVTYQSRPRAGLMSRYSLTEPNSYEDIRGFELTVGRNVGRWIQGFANYTYMVRTFGRFGFPVMYENPVLQEQENFVGQAWRAAQSKPRPQPYARLNLEMIVPRDFGPQLAGQPLLGDWRVGLLGSWQMGAPLVFPTGTLNELRLRDYYNWDMRFSRNFQVSGQRVQFFADITNLLNTRRLTFNGFVDGVDYTRYMTSLHLPAHPQAPDNIPGNDRPGDFRRDGVAWQPMTRVQTLAAAQPRPGEIFWVADTGQWMEYVNNDWRQVDQSRIDQYLRDKAYIEMPNQSWQTFLDPRQIFFGIRISL